MLEHKETMSCDSPSNCVLEINKKPLEYLITIVIPTYDRLSNLLELMKYLDANVGTRTCVYVVDNGSGYKYNAEYLASLRNVHFKMYENKYHLGPDASVLRAIELANTPWVYLLGDSKIPNSDALKAIEDDCLAHEDAWGIVYRFRNNNTANVDVRSIAELRDQLSDYGDLFLGGNSIISQRAVKKYFAQSSMYTLTRMPHAVFHLMSIKDGNAVHLSDRQLVDKFIPKPNHYNPGLSLIECWAQFALILCLPLNTKELAIINKMILDIENYSSIVIFGKFCLLQIFRYKKDIRAHLLRVLRYRYLYRRLSFERMVVTLAYLVALACTPFIAVEK